MEKFHRCISKLVRFHFAIIAISFQAFYMYLYLGSIIFLFYMYLIQMKEKSAQDIWRK